MNIYESALPLDITLELARSEDAGDPFAFRFGEQTYLVRREGGAAESAAMLWDDELFADLAALARSDPIARQRVGERVRTFIAQADWGAHEQAIAVALEAGRRVHVTLRFAAAELYLLPWELLTLKATGQHLGELADCLVHYEWPSTVTAAPTPDPPPEGGRILFAWSAAGGAVAVAEHLDLLRRTSAEGHHLFNPDRDVLPHVSLASLHDALAGPGSPIAVLHLLCHGGRLGTQTDAYGLIWDPSPPESALTLVDAGALRRVLERHKGTLRLVVLSACYSGNAGAPGNALGAVAQELHRIGIPAIIASRQPLSVPGSIALTETLYRHLLVDLVSLEDAFLAARARLMLDASSGDWASLQLYTRVADGGDHRPIVFRPYRGLAAFRPGERRFFFGREHEVADLVEALGEGRRLLTLVGASGSGKSSLAMAGLVPVVVEDRKLGRAFRAVILRPGARPCEALAAAMLSLGGNGAGDLRSDLRKQPEALIEAANARLGGQPGDPRLLLVVDQLEELFTQVEDRAEAVAFVAALLHASALPAGRIHAVLTLRADFLGRCLDFDREFAVQVKASTEIVLPMSEAELRRAILCPAALAGLRFDEGLVEALLDALREGLAASDLPLLAFALEALWERRRGSVIPWAAWESIGGLKGAIAQRADEVLAGCRDDEARQLVRDLFSRLVQLGLGTEDTRHYASRSELNAIAPERAEAELERWIAARLLTADEDEVWVAHEAVIRQWATLRRWLAEDREALLIRQELGQASRHWDDTGRSADELWRGARLGRASELREVGRLRLTAKEAAFLEAAEARRRKEIKRSRILAVAGVLVVLVVGMLGLRVWKQNLERQAQQEALLMASARERLAHNYPAVAMKLLLKVHAPKKEPGWVELANEVLNAGGLLVTLRGDPGYLHYATAFSPKKGTKILAVAWDNTVHLWNADGSGKPLVLSGHTNQITSATFSSDDTKIVTTSVDCTARVWNVDGSGEPIVLRGHEAPVRHAAFNPDGTKIITVANDGTSRMWKVDGSTNPIIVRAHKGDVFSAGFSADGSKVATASWENIARVWNADGSGTPVVLKGHTNRILSVKLSRDGTRVVTGSMDGTARVWRADGSGKPFILRGHESAVLAAAFSPDGTKIVTASEDNTARVWNADGSGDPIVLRGHDASVEAAAFSTDGTKIVTTSNDTTARVWNADGSGAPIILRGHEAPVALPAFSPDGTKVVTASFDNTVRVWDAHGSSEPITAIQGTVNSADVFDPQFKRVVRTDYWSGTTRVLSIDGSSKPIILKAHEVEKSAFSPDGKQIVTACKDGMARVWNADGSGEPIILRGHEREILNAVFSPDGKKIVTASADHTARVWNADNSGEPIVLRGHKAAVATAVFSPDGQRVLTGSTDMTTRVWNVDGSGEPVILKGHVTYVAAFSPDGRRIVTGSNDTRVWVRNADGSGIPLVLKEHQGPIYAVAFSSDGKLVATASADRTARVWHVDGSGRTLVLEHRTPVDGVAFDASNQRVITISWGDNLKFWRLSVPALTHDLVNANADCLLPDERVRYLEETGVDARDRYATCERQYGRVPSVRVSP